MSGKNFLSLQELNARIKTAVDDHLEAYYWIVAEISEISESRTGHCYLELIQKDTESDQPVAKAKAVIWAGVYRMVKPYFASATGHHLEQGINILVRVTVRFHEVYGLSLNITDIEPAYTMGDIELQRQETIRLLKEEGIFELNSSLPLPILPKRIAVISSPTAAGYGDFITQLNNNDYGFDIKTVIFPAYMQGNDAVASMIKALEKIYQYAYYFDVVVIIRGGGSRSELMCFDSYELASHICQFPIPVFSGIGHERDVSVADMVSHSRFKTPTATAQYIIDCLYLELSKIDRMAEDMVQYAMNLLDDNRTFIENNAAIIKNLSTGYLRLYAQKVAGYQEMFRKGTQYFLSSQRSRQKQNLKQLQYQSQLITASALKGQINLLSSLKKQPSKLIKTSSVKLDFLQKIVEFSDPGLILRRGFSVTLLNGKMVRDIGVLKVGDQVQTRLQNGTLESEVQTIKKQ